MTTLELLQKTRAAMGSIAAAGAEKKNALLLAMADSLEAHCAEILAANAEDMAAARGRITDVMLDRLKLDENRIAGMANGIRDTVRLPDHTGRVLSEVVRPNGIVIDKVQVPLGLVAIIYESRPNVTSDAAALAVKSGNVCMLRSGKEAYCSARAIVAALKAGVAQAGGDPDIVNIVEDTSHASAQELMTAKGLVDLLIPRGGAGLIRACVENATVPCIETGTGICHVYVDKAADLAKAVSIIVNAKASRPSVCNAEEVCLVHRDVAAQFLPLLKKAIVDDRAAAGLVPVELRLDPAAARIIDGTPAGERDFDTEFLDYILAVGVVDSVDAAIAHIAAHSTHHSDCIVTEDAAAAKKFTEQVDSAAVYVNVSTRFTDGGEFGLGCEMGISTQKLHARGPMGLDELCTYKYVVRGSGQIRQYGRRACARRGEKDRRRPHRRGVLHAGALRGRRAAARLHGGNAAAHPLGQPLRLSRRQAADGRRRGRGPQGGYSGLRGHLRLHARGRESREARAAARRGQEDHPHHAEYALRRGAGADPLRGEWPRERG